MTGNRTIRFRLRGPLLAVMPVALALCCAPAWAQQADRERAQMLQMQQQLQRLQSDNAAIQKERNELQVKAQEADKLKQESAKTGAELAHARQAAAAQGKEVSSLRGDLANSNARLAAAQAELDTLRKALAARDDSLQAAALEKRRMEASQALLAVRLKAQTAKADLCESRHAGLMQFTSGVIDTYEADRLRLCEPVTGLWRIRPQARIQQMRADLYGYRLDIPAPAVAGNSAAVAEPAAAGTPQPPVAPPPAAPEHRAQAPATAPATGSSPPAP